MPFPLPLFLALGAGAALLAMGKKSAAKEAAKDPGPVGPGAADPSATFCEAHGGKFVVRKELGGTTGGGTPWYNDIGYCQLPDGREVKAWDFLRGAVPSEPGDTEPGGTEPGYEEPGGTEPGYEEPGGTEPGYEEPGGTAPGGTVPDSQSPGTFPGIPGSTPAAPLSAPTGLKEAIAAGRVDELIQAALTKKDPRTMWALGLALTKEKDEKLQSKGQLLCAVALQTARKDGSLPAIAAEIIARDNTQEITTTIYAADLLASMPEEAPYKTVWTTLSTGLKNLHSGATADAEENAATAEAATDAATILNQGLMAAGTYLNELLKGDAKTAADKAAAEAAAKAKKAEADRVARETAAAAAAAAALKLPEYVVGARTLKLTSPPMRGTDVRDLQATLNIQYGASPKLKIDGIFGNDSRVAVTAFQKGRYNAAGKPLAVDGQVGPDTWWALSTGGGKKAPAASPSPTPSTPSAPAAGLAQIAVGSRTLKYVTPNMSGTDVRDLQGTLNDRYAASPKLKVDGLYGKNSFDAVKVFQKGRFNAAGKSLGIDGIVGPDTWWALSTGGNKSTTPAAPTPTTSASTPSIAGLPQVAPGSRTLKYVTPNTKGTDVLEVQKSLNSKYGASPKLKEDGVYGSNSFAAVKVFQKGRFNALGKPLGIDGIVGPDTWWALGTGGAAHPQAEAAPAPVAVSTQPSTQVPMPASRGADVTIKITSPMTRGPKVTELQELLNWRGATVKIDGIYGNESFTAVEAFQSRHLDPTGKPLVVDGVVGTKTWWSLRNDHSGIVIAGLSDQVGSLSLSDFKRVMRLTNKPYMKGTDVYALQMMLYHQIESVVPFLVDGIFGPATRNAVIVYQQRNGLKADGIAGSRTLSKLVGSTLNDVKLGPVAGLDSGGATERRLHTMRGSAVLGVENYPSIARSLQKIMLQPGMKGKGPALLQIALNRWAQGNFKLKVDGNFGPKTAAAVKVAQIESGQMPTGLVNKDLWQKINGGDQS